MTWVWTLGDRKCWFSFYILLFEVISSWPPNLLLFIGLVWFEFYGSCGRGSHRWLKRMEQLSFTEELFSELLYPFAEYVLSNWKINQCLWAGQQSKAHQVYIRAAKVRHTLVSSANNRAWDDLMPNVGVVIFPCSTGILLGSPAQGWGWAEFQMWCISSRLFSSLHSPINHNLNSFSQALVFFFPGKQRSWRSQRAAQGNVLCNQA